MDFNVSKRKKTLVVFVIDFSTFATTVAYSWIFNTLKSVRIVQQHFNNSLSHRQYTRVLIKPDGQSLHSFGYDAEIKYLELTADNRHGDWYFYRTLQTENQWSTNMRDVTGNVLTTETVYALTIKYFVAQMAKHFESRLCDIQHDEILWVFPVFAGCNKTTKQALLDSAVKAGISKESILIITRTQGVVAYLRFMPHFDDRTLSRPLNMNPGTKYVILDVGQHTYEFCWGGEFESVFEKDTATATVVQIKEDGSSCEKSSGRWTFDNWAQVFVRKLFGESTAQKIRDKAKEDNITVVESFRTKLKNITTENILIFRTDHWMENKCLHEGLENHAHIRADKLTVDTSVMKKIFKESVGDIVDHVSTFLVGCSAVVLVGELSETPLLQEAIKKAFPEVGVICPHDSRFTMVKGAVAHGHYVTKNTN